MNDQIDHTIAEDMLEDHDRGLSFDLSMLVARRNLLKMLAGAGAAAVLAACGSSSSTGALATAATSTGSTTNASTGSTVTAATAHSTASTVASSTGSSGPAASTAATANVDAVSATGTAAEAIPEETAGPYPGDGSNGVDVLSESGIVRRDIRSSFGSSTTVASGVDTTIELTIVDAATGAALPGAAVYLWHCDQAGEYSMYSDRIKNENYLRGVQAADSNGLVTFESIYPACYSGRWPHIHFEVYPSSADATTASNKLATSQLALPEATNAAVYATSGYEQSITNAKRVTLASDNVFSDDGGVREIPTVTGNVTTGLTMTFTVPVDT